LLNTKLLQSLGQTDAGVQGQISLDFLILKRKKERKKERKNE